MSVSILVISYNTREMTLACLRSLFEAPGTPGQQVIVLDNASSDGSADAIEAEFGGRLELLRLTNNIGFAAGNNRAARRATGEWLLLLNPDTVVLDDAVGRLLSFAESHPDAGIYGGKTLFADGSLNPKSCWMRVTPWSVLCQAIGLARFRYSRLFNPEQPDAWRGGRPVRVDIVSGCFLLIRRSLWEALGGFDESFFMYGEEADLCLRAKRHGAAPVVTEDAVIIHYGGASEAVRAAKLIRLLHAKFRLCRRHWRQPALAGPLMALWPATRLLAFTIVSLARPAKRADRDTWRAVWAARQHWLNDKGGFDAANP
jgi:GT2 family glycosyltransferase